MNTRPNFVTHAGTIYYAEFDHGHGYVFAAGGEANIVDLFVEAEHRGQGLGEAYLAELLTIARKKGAHRVVAHVRPDNLPSHRAFKRAGFEVTSAEDHMELEFPGCAH